MPNDSEFMPITKTDTSIGVEYSVTQCDDRSGFVCRIIDFYTGVILGKPMYASDAQLVLEYAERAMHGRPVSVILNN